MSGNNIKVVCRFRPQNKREIAEGGVPVVDVDDDGLQVRIDNGKDIKADFAFDRIFPTGTKQSEIFDYGIRETVDDVFNGYNGTVFAYGQTGAGKTFTMMGDIDSDEYKGVVPRIAETIFHTIMISPPTMEYTVKVAYMEIYMEKIRDLLNPVNDNLNVHEDKVHGIYVKGLVEVYVSSIEEVYEVLHRGGQARIVASTNMNAESSRSHSIFQITIGQKNLNDGSIKSGRLYLVDLAGSEKVGKTGASGQTLEEAKKINKSLSALGIVINALTDGKSKHIPYRDSKLTRILQESLGGNSRTTLIINCSPSSFNDFETLSTLRFGMRAKSIKNKAKVNADLSPAELKALLKKVKGEAITFQAYISALEGEVIIWRSGGTVKPEDQASMEKITGMKKAPPKAIASPPNSTSARTPASTANVPAPTAVEETKAIEEILSGSRSSSPTRNVAEDEREEFLKRENELLDQIGEKEEELQALQKAAELAREELAQLKEEMPSLKEDNDKMSTEINDLKLQLEKVTYESKEAKITMDGYQEANDELRRELSSLKIQLAELRQQKKNSMEESKAKKKSEKMALMMADLDTGNIHATERAIRDTLVTLEKIDGDTENITPNAEVQALRYDLNNANITLEQQKAMIAELGRENTILTQKRDELEMRLTTLEVEYEELLDKTIADEEAGATFDIAETLQELKVKLEAQYANKRDQQQKEIEELKSVLSTKNEDLQKSLAQVNELKRANEELSASVSSAEHLMSTRKDTGTMSPEKEKELDRIRKTMAQQLTDFDTMKKALMRDLQNRCEKVVELEISLDEVRDQYHVLLRNSDNKVQQKRMAFLERNLEQLTAVQKNLVEQNTKLKKDFDIAERKIIARNERIQSLELLLQDAQNKLVTQNQKFEAQLSAVRERLEQARTQKQATTAFPFGRIAKPLRGGGVAPELNGSPSPKETAADKANKRMSWLNWSKS